MYLNVKNISFSYNNTRKILNNISFTVNKGETLAIVGASGTGKSTILRLIAGILPIKTHKDNSGNIVIDNKSPIEYLKKGKLSFMFQEPTLFPNLNVKENIEVPLKIKNNPNFKKVSELIETVGLNGFENYLPKDLSGGMKTRVSLARSFTNDPELLLLDEPFSSLDIGWKQNLYDGLQQFRMKTYTAVIMVTHDIQEAIYLANKIIVLGRDGGIIDIQINNKEQLKSSSSLSNIHELYPHELSKIQTLITTDSFRNNFNPNDYESIFKNLTKLTGIDNVNNEYYKELITKIREISNKETINKKLIDLYNIATLEQKFCLVWDIFQKPQSYEFTKKVFDEIYNNLEKFNDDSKKFYGANEDNIFSVLQHRINGSNENSPSGKKWLYLCNLLISSDIEQVENVLTDTKNKSITTLEYPFASYVAEKLLIKVNEKKHYIFNS